MALVIRHDFISAKSDGPDSTMVRPSNWNASHRITLTGNRLIGRPFGPDGDATEISISSNLTLVGGVLDISATATLPGTGAVTVPSGTTAQRPSPPANGMIRYNTTLNAFEKYENGAWGPLFALPDNVTIKNLTVTGTAEFTNTSGMVIPRGTEAERDLVPQNGTIRYNTDVPCFEMFVDDQWAQLTNSVKVGKRQTVLEGPMGVSSPTLLPASSGTLSLSTQNVTSTTHLVVTTAGGEGPAGDIDLVGYSESNLAFPAALPSKAINSITISGGTATVTTASAHGLKTNAIVVISGATSANYNGVYSINVLSPTTFSYIPTTTPSGNATVVGSYTVTNFFGFTVNANGLITPIVTAQPPVYSPGQAPSVELGQYTFDYYSYRMWLGNGTTADQVFAVFIGEGQAAATALSNVIAYGYRGRYRALVGPVVAGNGIAQFNHNLGVTQLRGKIMLQCQTANNDYQVGDVTEFLSAASSVNTVVQAPMIIRDRLTGLTGRGNAGLLVISPTGGILAVTTSQWLYLVDLERFW